MGEKPALKIGQWQFSIRDTPDSSLPTVDVAYRAPDYPGRNGEARVTVNKRGRIVSDNWGLLNSMPEAVDAAYSGYVVGVWDGAHETRTSPGTSDFAGHYTKGREGWEPTGNDVALSTPASTGWRIASFRTIDEPRQFKSVVTAPNGHKTEYTLDNHEYLVTQSTAKEPLPEAIHNAAFAMAIGHLHGATLAKGMALQEQQFLPLRGADWRSVQMLHPRNLVAKSEIHVGSRFRGSGPVKLPENAETFEQALNWKSRLKEKQDGVGKGMGRY